MSAYLHTRMMEGGYMLSKIVKRKDIEFLATKTVILNKDGIIEKISRDIISHLGFSEEQIVGKHLSEVFPDLKINLNGKQSHIENYKINDSNYVVNIIPVMPSGYILIFLSESGLKKISKIYEFERVNKELNSIIESCYDGIYVTDNQGNTLRLNKSFERISGLSKEQLIGKNVMELVNQGILADSATHKVIKTKQPVTIIQKVKSGKHLLVSCCPVLDDKGEIFRIVTNARDMTELNNLREQLQESQTLAEKYHSELTILRQQKQISKKIITKSSEMKRLVEVCRRLADFDSTVLILGESGVGKGLIARCIHDLSPRCSESFVEINCGAIPENLLESELFGYEAGAFTGANKKKKMGLFELAHKGTIFLDEIAEMPYNLQAKLLRVLQEKEIRRIGGLKPVKVDVRVIAATNKDIEEMVNRGRFREDLFYRLNVVPITIPPLRQRREDIIPLAINFLEEFNKKHNQKKHFTEEVLQHMMFFDWKGNVRELKNLVERLVILSKNDVIDINDLIFIDKRFRKSEKQFFKKDNNYDMLTLEEAKKEFEKNLIMSVVQKVGSMRKAAEVLGVNPSTISRKLRK